MATTKKVSLKEIMQKHKLNDGKAARRKLRAHFKGNHEPRERWEFTTAQVAQVLEILGVTEKKPTKRTRKPKAKPAQPPAVKTTETAAA